MKAVPIPGQILRTSVFLGLTFDELVALGAIPFVVVLPSVMIRQIPLIVTVGFGVVVAVFVGFVALQSPDGQTPLEWGPAAFRRRVTPDRYYVKPRETHRASSTYLDVVQTQSAIESDERSVKDLTLLADSAVESPSGSGFSQGNGPESTEPSERSRTGKTANERHGDKGVPPGSDA